MVGEWGRMVGMKRDGTHIVVDALQSSLSLQSRSTMHSTFESAEARLRSAVELHSDKAGDERPVSCFSRFY